jgi:hypothetical protein
MLIAHCLPLDSSTLGILEPLKIRPHAIKPIDIVLKRSEVNISPDPAPDVLNDLADA